MAFTTPCRSRRRARPRHCSRLEWSSWRPATHRTWRRRKRSCGCSMDSYRGTNFPSMDKQSVSHTLDQLAAVLELRGESAGRVRAVQRVARSEILATGRSSALDELREQVPPGLVEILRMPGLVVTKVRLIQIGRASCRERRETPV